MSDNEKINADEVVRSLNGFEDIAIEKAFGVALLKMDEMRASRALLFILKRRDGANDFDAYKGAMEVTFGDLMDTFETEDDDEDAAESAAAALDGRGN